MKRTQNGDVLLILIVTTLFLFSFPITSASSLGKIKITSASIGGNISAQNIVSSNYSIYSKGVSISSFNVYFGNNSNVAEPVRFERDGYYFIYDISGSLMQWREQPGFPSRVTTLGGGYTSNSKTTSLIIDKNKATYANAFSFTNITYEVFDDIVKENFVLSSLTSGIKEYTYLEYTGNIKFSKELNICANGKCFTPSGNLDDFSTSGQIDFRDAKNKTIFFLQAPIITDSKGNKISALYVVHGSNAQMNFYLRIPTSFLRTAVYPIYIDPTIEVPAIIQETKSISYSDNNSQTNFTLYKNQNGAYSNTINDLFVYVNNDTLKFGANDSSLTGNQTGQFKYFVNSNQYLTTKIGKENGYVYPILSYKINGTITQYSFKDICSKNYSNCNWFGSKNNFTIYFNSTSIIDPTIIVITSASWLDSSFNFIQDIYDYVYRLDNSSILIPNNNYVKLIFASNLTNKNDITIYAKSNVTNSSVEIYNSNMTYVIQINNITNNSIKKYRAELYNLSVNDSVFFLKVLGDTWMDYVIDPSSDFDIPPSPADSSYTKNTTITFRISGAGGYYESGAQEHFCPDASSFEGKQDGLLLDGNHYSWNTPGCIDPNPYEWQYYSLYNTGDNVTEDGKIYTSLYNSNAQYNPEIYPQYWQDSGLATPWYCNYTNNSMTEGTHSYLGNVFISTGINGCTIPSLLASTITRTFTVDTTAPTTASPTFEANNFYRSNHLYSWSDYQQTNSLNVTNFSCSDSASGCNKTWYCIDTTNSCNPDIEFTAPFEISTEGSQYIRYFSMDNAGNNESNQSFGFIVDKTNPDIVINFPLNGSVINSVGWSGHFSATITDALTSIDSTLYSWDGSTYSSDLGNPTEGINTLYIKATDVVSNINITSVTFSYDNIIPNMTVNFPSTGNLSVVINSANLLLNISVNEPASSCTWGPQSYSYGGNVMSTSDNITFTMPASIFPEGQTTDYYFQCTDSAGNPSDVLHSSFVYDNTAPTLTINYPLNSDYVNYTNWNNFYYSASEGACSYSWDGSSYTPLNNCSDFNVGTPTEGSNTIYIKAIDGAFNSNIQSSTFVYDTTPPTWLGYGAAADGSNLSIGSLSFAMNGNPPNEINPYYVSADVDGVIKNLTCTFDGSGNNCFDYNNIDLYTGLSEGYHTFNVTFWDKALNSNTTDTRTIYVDLTDPVVNITFPIANNYYNYYNQINFSVTENHGLTNCWYSKDGGATNSTPESCIIGDNYLVNESALSEGLNTWTIYANDSSGRIGSNQVSFYYDISLPTPSIISPAEGSYFNTVFNLAFTTTDGADNCWYSYDGINSSQGSCSSFSGVFSIDPSSLSLSQGSHVFIVYENDSAGNIGNSGARNLIYDSINPDVSISYPIQYGWYNSSIDFKFTPTDTNLANCSYSLDGGSTILGTQNCTTGVENTFSSLTPINYMSSSQQVGNNWTVYGTDLAGNTNSASVQFYYDIEAPTGYYCDINNICYGNGNNNAYGLNPVDNFYINTSDVIFQSRIGDNGIYGVNSINNSILHINGNDYDMPYSGDYVNIGGVPYYIYNQSVNLPDGTYIYNVTAFDKAGNNYLLATRTVTVDTIAPSDLVIIYPSANPSINDTSLQSNFAYSVTADSCKYSYDNSTWYDFTSCSDHTLTNLPISQGDNYIYVKALDLAGNSQIVSAEFNYDTIAPSDLVINSPTTSSYYNQSNLSSGGLSYSVSANNCSYSWDGSNYYLFSSCSDSVLGNFPSDGLVTLYIKARDLAGNSQQQNVQFYLDDVAPVLSGASSIGITSNSTPDFNFYSDTAGTISYLGDCSSGTASASAGINSVVFNTLADGVHSNCKVLVIDSAGNPSLALDVPSFSIDTTTPSISIISPSENGIYNLSTFNFAYGISGTNLDVCQYSLNNGVSWNLLNCDNSSTIVPSEGSNQLLIKARNTAGTESTSNSGVAISFTYDTTLPQISITYPTASDYSAPVTHLDFSASDSHLSSCKYSLDGGITNTSVDCNAGTISGLLAQEGSNTWIVYANDSAGNINFTRINFTVNYQASTPPEGSGGSIGGWVYPNITGTGIVNGSYNWTAGQNITNLTIPCDSLSCNFDNFINNTGKYVMPSSPKTGAALLLIPLFLLAVYFEKKKKIFSSVKKVLLIMAAFSLFILSLMYYEKIGKLIMTSSPKTGFIIFLILILAISYLIYKNRKKLIRGEKNVVSNL